MFRFYDKPPIEIYLVKVNGWAKHYPSKDITPSEVSIQSKDFYTYTKDFLAKNHLSGYEKRLVLTKYVQTWYDLELELNISEINLDCFNSLEFYQLHPYIFIQHARCLLNLI